MGKRRSLMFSFGLGAAVSLCAGQAHATETVTYNYDALGRLTSSSSSGSVNNGVTASSTYDAAGNRANYTVTGSSNSGPPVTGVIVLPLGGFTVIPLTGP